MSNPPPRPGATLWSIAAGPLVNVVLIPILSMLIAFERSLGWALIMPNAYGFLRSVWYINVGLLIFNLLPIYPLDGGQILRSLLWFVMGRARSLDGSYDRRFRRCRGIHSCSPANAVRLVRSSCRSSSSCIAGGA